MDPPLLPFPLGLRWPLLAGHTLQLLSNASSRMTQPGCYSASLLLAAAFFFPLLLLFQSIILPLRQDRVSLTALTSAYE